MEKLNKDLKNTDMWWVENSLNCFVSVCISEEKQADLKVFSPNEHEQSFQNPTLWLLRLLSFPKWPDGGTLGTRMRAGKLGFKCSLGLASTEDSEMSAGLWGRI